MQIILLETISNLGNLGDLINVKAGYARNFLIPQGKAKPATAANLAEFKTIKANLESKKTEAIKIAQSKADAIAGVVCSFKVNASEEGKLFGAVTTADIKDSLAKAGHEVEKRNINLSEAIHHIGEYDISITLHTNITANIKIVLETAKEKQ